MNIERKIEEHKKAITADPEIRKFLDQQLNLAIAELQKLPLEEIEKNEVNVYAVFPFWTDFIEKWAKLPTTTLEKFQVLSNQQKIDYIKIKHPNFQFMVFWVLVMMAVVKDFQPEKK